MSRNLWLVLGTAVVYGLATGVYEFVLPLFLRAQGISLQNLGIIFALAGAAVVLVRIYMGGLSDHWGRKRLYGWALAVCGGAAAITPLLPAVLWQLVLKTVRETAALTRETIHPIVLYEERRDGFLNLIGKFRGFEFLFQAGGTLLAGAIIGGMAVTEAGYRTALYTAGVALVLVALWWAIGFREQTRPAGAPVMRLRDLFTLDLHPNLKMLLISGIVFTFGMQLSHSFYLPLFFTERFGATAGATPKAVALVMALHRVTIALPLLLVGELRLRNLRAWYVWGLIAEGITMGGSALIPTFWLSASVFLLHDFIGAGIWVPIQALLIQRYSRDATRGIEVGKVLAWSSIGSIIGPLAAGALAARSPIYPFFFSGLFMALAAIPLLPLNHHAPAPAAEPEPVA